jgi:hypothetical protein
MIRYRVSQAACVLGALCLINCKDSRKSGSPDSTTPVIDASPSSQPVVVNTGWDAREAGPMLIVADSTGLGGFMILPALTDSSVASVSNAQLDSAARGAVELFDRSGSRGFGSIAGVSQPASTEGCITWPPVTLQNVATQWRVGFMKGVAQALPLDSLDGVNSADSVMITTELARLASAVSVTGDPVYRGLPFSVRKAFRFNDASSSILIGSVVRKINEEANPREEHILLVAEKPLTGGSYVTAFHTRAAGAEDPVRTSEILALVRFAHDARPAFVVSFEYADGGRVALIERIGARTWKMTWRSAYTGC